MKKLSFFLAAMISLAASAQGNKKMVADRIIGVVGDRIILQSDISNAIADAMRNGATLPPNADCIIMEQALVSKLLMLQAEKDSLPVSDEEVEAELDQKVRYYIRQVGSQEAVEEMAGKSIYQIKDDARPSVKESKLAQAMQRKIVDNVRITPTEVQTYFNKIPVDSLPFFESELEIGQIVIYPKPSKDLEQYVIDEMNNYKRQVESKVTTFEALVKRYSEDPGSKDRDGEYQVNRQEKDWDPAFLAAAFRLKEGEISNVVRSKFGFHLLKLVSRKGDDAVVRHLLRRAPVTDEEITRAINKLDTVRSRLITGAIDFNSAAGKYSEDETSKYSGPYITGRSNSTYVTIDELDKEIVAQLDKMKVGEFSQPHAFTNERGDKGVRLLYLKTRTQPHRMNLKDDYSKIATAALEEKKASVMEKWLVSRIPTYYISIDPVIASCSMLQKWVPAQSAPKSF